MCCMHQKHHVAFFHFVTRSLSSLLFKLSPHNSKFTRSISSKFILEAPHLSLLLHHLCPERKHSHPKRWSSTSRALKNTMPLNNGIHLLYTTILNPLHHHLVKLSLLYNNSTIHHISSIQTRVSCLYRPFIIKF